MILILAASYSAYPKTPITDLWSLFFFEKLNDLDAGQVFMRRKPKRRKPEKATVRCKKEEKSDEVGFMR